MRVLGGVAHAKIKGEPGKKNTRETSIAQIAYKTGRRLAVILIEGGVGVDRAMDALAQHERGMRDAAGPRGIRRRAWLERNGLAKESVVHNQR